MKYQIIFILLIFALASSLVLSVKPLSEICNLEGGCEIVQNSVYSEFSGMKVSYIGVFAFSLLAVLVFWQIIKPTRKKEKFIQAFLLVGSLIALYLLYLQYAVIESYCRYCLVADVSVIIAFIASITLKKV